MSYNEPYERKLMNQPKLKLKAQKMLLKAAVSAGFALVLGYVYKAELQVEDRLDEKYEQKQRALAASEETIS